MPSTAECALVRLRQAQAWHKERLLSCEVQLPSLKAKPTQHLHDSASHNRLKASSRHLGGLDGRAARIAAPAQRRLQSVAVAQVQHARLVRDCGKLIATPPGCLHLRQLALHIPSPSLSATINHGRKCPCCQRGYTYQMQACSASAGHAPRVTLRAFNALQPSRLCSQVRNLIALYT